jgi:hypothetical protein
MRCLMLLLVALLVLALLSSGPAVQAQSPSLQDMLVAAVGAAVPSLPLYGSSNAAKNPPPCTATLPPQGTKCSDPMGGSYSVEGGSAGVPGPEGGRAITLYWKIEPAYAPRTADQVKSEWQSKAKDLPCGRGETDGDNSCKNSSAQPGAIDINVSGDPYFGSAQNFSVRPCGNVWTQVVMSLSPTPAHGARNKKDVMDALKSAAEGKLEGVTAPLNGAVDQACGQIQPAAQADTTSPPAGDNASPGLPVQPVPAPASAPQTPTAAACFPAGSNVQVADDEIAQMLAQKDMGRSPEDIRADIDALNRSRGGSGAPTCPPTSAVAVSEPQSHADKLADGLKQNQDGIDSITNELQDLLNQNQFCGTQALIEGLHSRECASWVSAFRAKFDTQNLLEGYRAGLQFVGTDEAIGSRIADVNAHIAEVEANLAAQEAARPDCADAFENFRATTASCGDIWPQWSGYRNSIHSAQGELLGLKALLPGGDYH